MGKILKLSLVFVVLGVVLNAGFRYGLGLGNPVIYEQNGSYGYFPVPNQDVTRFGSHVSINHAGMRSTDFSDAKPADIRRVLFVGDSVTFGPTFVDQRDIFATLVPAEMNLDNGGKWESLNASAPEWATGNELGFVRSRGIFGADVVALVINTGDLTQKFSVSDGTGSYPTKRPPFAIYEAIFRYALPRLGLAPHIAADRGSTGEITNAIPVTDVLENIAEFRSIVEASGARFILVYVPAFGGKWSDPAWATYHRALNEWAHETHCRLVDLSAAMQATDVSLDYFDGIHLRPLGQQAVAKEIAAALVAATRSN